MEAYNYSLALNRLKHFKESKALLREKMLVARRVLGEEHTLTLKIRDSYAEALYNDGGGTLADLREVVTILEDTIRIARRVLWMRRDQLYDLAPNVQCRRCTKRYGVDPCDYLAWHSHRPKRLQVFTNRTLTCGFRDDRLSRR